MNKRVDLFFSLSFILNLNGQLQEGVQNRFFLGALLFKIGLILTGLTIIVFIRLFKSYSTRRIAFSNKHSRYEWIVFLSILCTAAFLRFYGLNDGLWLDEILTQVNYMKASFREIFTTYDSQNQHFLYSLLSHSSYLLFGESAWALRLPAALFGLAGIYALYVFGEEVSSRRETILSCALFAFSYHHIWFSQNARGYTGLLFFTLLGSWFLIRGLNENRPGQWIGYGIVAALGAYTHIMMVPIVFSHFLIYLLHLYRYRQKDLDNRWMPLLGFFLSGVLTFQLYSFVLPQMLGGTISHGNIVANWKNPLWALMEFVKGVNIGLKGIVPGIIGLGIFIAGLWDFARRKSVVIELFIFPAVIVGFITIAMGHHIWPRLFFFTFGFIVLILTRGCMQSGCIIIRLLKFEQRKSTVFGTVLFLIILLASAVSVPSVYGPKQDYLGALCFVEKNRGSEDIVFSVGAAGFVYERFYKADWKWAENVEDIKAALQSSKSVWLIYTLPFHLESVYPEIMSLIKREFIVAERYDGTLNGGTIYVCRNKGWKIVKNSKA